MLNKIKEHFEASGVSYLRFYFANGKSVKAEQLLVSDEQHNLIHIYGENKEMVINLENVLYYEITEKRKNGAAISNQNAWS